MSCGDVVYNICSVVIIQQIKCKAIKDLSSSMQIDTTTFSISVHAASWVDYEN